MTEKTLKKIRKKAGIGQCQLASRSGLSQSMISHIESGRYPLTDFSKPKITKAILELARERLNNLQIMVETL